MSKNEINNIERKGMNSELVKQAYEYSKKQGIKTTLRETYQTLVGAGYIELNGEPTQDSINKGLIAKINPNDFMNLKYNHFLKKCMNEAIKCDEKVPSDREIYLYLVKNVIIDTQGLPTKLAEEKHLTEFNDYIPSLEYQDDMTIEEFVKASRPLQKYSYDHFTKLGRGQGFGYDISVTYDLCKRVVNGELVGDVKQARRLMEDVKNRYSDDIQPL